jgi:SAM-dependent methyltransferase
VRIPMDTKDAGFWDEWWRDRLSQGRSDDKFPRGHQVPLVRDRGNLNYHGTDNDDLLATVMAEYGLRTVLCAGNGVSQEPRALAAAGFDVTALDISPVAVACAQECQDNRGLNFCSAQMRRPGGRVEFVVGDLLDLTVCPGPFDVVMERRTVQWFAERERPTALSALSGRLGESGIFLSECLDDAFPLELGWSQHKLGWFHASESWFRTNGWTIWDGCRSSTLGRSVAWLVRTGSMKPPPRGQTTGQTGTV